MKKDKTPSSKAVIVPTEPTVVQNAIDSLKLFNQVFTNTKFQNTTPFSPNNFFGAAMNQPGFPGGGMGTSGWPNDLAISDTATLFQDLRWFMVSNLRQLLSQSFVEIGLIQTIVTVPIDDGLRGGFMFKSKQLNEDQIKQLHQEMKREGDIETAGWASKWERLYGGGGILILVDDQDPEEELDLASIGLDTVVEFRDVDMWELYFDQQNTESLQQDLEAVDPLEAGGEFYNYYNRKIHKSRVLKLKGLRAPSFIRPRLRGWGLSVVETLVRSINQYLKATELGFEVLDEFKVDVYGIKNLVTTLLSPTGGTAVMQRVQMANWQKNFQNAVVMDSEDTFDHKQVSFAGLAETMEGIRMQVAADMRMPIIKLFGQSVSKGLGDASQSEMENYNSMIESEVRLKLEFHLLRMGEIRCQQLFGIIPDDLEGEFKPLRELSGEEQENVKTQKFTRVSAAKAAGELSTLEYRDACNKGALFDIQLDTIEDDLNPEDPEIEQISSGERESDEDPEDDKESEGKAPDKKPKDKVKNSPQFDKASYQADGGSDWDDRKRIRGLLELGHIRDNPLFKKAEAASVAAMGAIDLSFALWWYKKQGGKI